MGGVRGVLETSAVSAERKKADLEAFKEEATSRGYSSPSEFQKDLSTMDYGQKGQVIEDWAQKHGVSKEQAARALANITGDHHFVNAVKSAGEREAAGGVQSWANLQEWRGKIDTYSFASALRTMRKYGYTEEDYGGAKGFPGAAKGVAFLENFKGGNLTEDEYLRSQVTGMLSEVGMNQAIDRASKTLGMSPKEFQHVLRNWGNVNEFMRFSMEQKFADSLGISYEKLAQYKHGFMELTVPGEGLGNFGKEPGGLGDLSGIKADHREAGYEILKKQGYSPESFGGARGYSEAARIVGEIAHLKGAELGREEISKAHHAGILSESGLNQAIAKAAKTLDMDPKDMNRALSTGKGVSEFINLAETLNTGQRTGMSPERLSQFKGDFAAVATKGGARSLGEISGMTGDHRSVGFKNLQQHGYTAESFGGKEDYEQAARIVGEMSVVKGEDLSAREISRFQKAGMLTESGLNQVIDKASKTVGIDRKDMNKALGNWEGVNKLVDFTETQNKPVDFAVMGLANLSQSRQKFAEMAVSAAVEPGRTGADQGGRYGVAFTPDGAVEWKSRRAGTDTKAGDFEIRGHDNTLVDKTTLDYQDVSKAGVLMSRGTIIDDKTAFEMAKKGDPELVRMVTNPYISNKEREAQIGVLSRTLGSAISAFIDRKGMSSDYTSGSASLSVGAGGGIIFKASGEAKGSIGGDRTDRKTTDLRIQESDTLIRETLASAKERNLSVSATRELLSDAIADKIDAVHLEARNNSPDKFGAAAPGNLINKYIKQGTKELGKSIEENTHFAGPR